ncbi:MAG: Ig domain protein group 1 domain protein [Gemmatimonadetes bacterium]|nr:Ig domain protein group 1 domain protein [Gemmatimonadota bacterium]
MIPVPLRFSWFQHVSRGVAVTASTGAAFVSIVTALYSYGVIGRSESHQSIGNVGAAWVRLRPAVDTATALGDTVLFAATIADSKGSILIGAAPVWTTGDSSIATVAADGSVIARGPGATTVNVVVGRIVSSARVVVRPRVASVTIDHPPADSGVSLLEGAQVQLRARPLDARGHLVASAIPAWRSEDSTIAAVDAHGMLSAQNAGRGSISVTVQGATAALPVTVAMTAADLAAVAGNDQRALAGRTLAQRIVVRATNRKGAPAAGKLVTFRLKGGQGRLDPATAVTDADGRARTQWTLGDDPGRQVLLAGVESLDSTIVVAAEADPVSANTRVTSLVDALQARAGSVLGDSVGIRVTDSSGRALAGVPVRWEAARGSVEPIATRTDSTGLVRARWTLGTATGRQRLHAIVGSADSRIAPVVITAMAIAGAPASMALGGGDRQRGTAGAPLAEPVLIRVMDAAGNGTAGVTLTLAPSGGTMRDSVVVTDSLGVARARWTLGRSAGEYTLVARVEGVQRALRATAQASPAAPANLSFDDAPATHGGRRTEKRLVALVALVADVYGNPVPDAPVTFTAKSGTVTPGRGVTDSHGRVALRWVMGSGVAEQRLIGSVRGAGVSGAYQSQPAPAGSDVAVAKARRGTR